MAKPIPWSYTGLDQFKNCPRQFYEVRVAKTVKDEPGEAQIWGTRVHEAFEARLAHRTPLPPELAEHEDFLKRLEDKPGIPHTELKIAFNAKAKPCNFFDRDVWYRGVIDLLKVSGDSAFLVDYKTGKPHDKWEQLYLFAIHTFAMFPVNLVNAQFYWTKTGTVTKKVIGRDEVPKLWGVFLPDLRQYAQAFKDDTWQPRPSGLCAGWCPVTTCEHWKPKRKK